MQSNLKGLNYTQWHQHIEAELQKAYKKLKLKKNENVQTVSPRESFDLPRVQEGSIQPN